MKRIVIAAVAAVGLVGVSCNRAQEKRPAIQTAAIERRDIVVEVEATGVIEPINVVEVKSKSSGQIVRMPVETGTSVKAGDLLVQLDTRDVRNQYDQTLADLRAAEAKLNVSVAQKRRSDTLWAQRVITAQEHETAALDYSSSTASVVRARTNLDLAQQRLEDATVRAPVAGTVIEKPVSLGQVIASGTSAQGGGTTILKMADLNSVRARVLVTETDIGQVVPGQTARVTVDAYPERRFTGAVEKIEPQAVVQQSVTMFPVLVTLSNKEGLLKPGMNGEVAILVESRLGVLSVPNDAVRNPRDAVAVADLLGVSADSIRAKMQQAFSGMGGGQRGARRQGAGAPPSGAATKTVTSPGSVAEGDLQGGQGGGGGQGSRMQLPDVTDAQCAAVTAAFTKNPEAKTRLEAIRERMRSGDMDRVAARDESQKLYESLKLDGMVARACQFRDARNAGGGEQQRTPRTSAAGAPTQRPASSTPSVGTQRDDPMAASGGPTPPNRARARAAMVFVGDSGKFEPRMIMAGVSNYDFTEVVSGAKEGEKVALLAAASMAAQRQAQTDRMRSMTGGAVPGMTQQTPAGGGRRP